MSAQCTTRHNILFRMSWGNVVCAARDGHRMPWSTSVWRRGVGGQHADAKAVAGADFSALQFESPGEGKCLQSYGNFKFTVVYREAATL
jgi:hypothetical protein